MRRLQQKEYEVFQPAAQDREKNSSLSVVQPLMSTEVQEREPSRESVAIPSHTMRRSALVTCLPTHQIQLAAQWVQRPSAKSELAYLPPLFHRYAPPQNFDFGMALTPIRREETSKQEDNKKEELLTTL